MKRKARRERNKEKTSSSPSLPCERSRLQSFQPCAFRKKIRAKWQCWNEHRLQLVAAKYWFHMALYSGTSMWSLHKMIEGCIVAKLVLGKFETKSICAISMYGHTTSVDKSLHVLVLQFANLCWLVKFKCKKLTFFNVPSYTNFVEYRVWSISFWCASDAFWPI